jgi:hypothetical protein
MAINSGSRGPQRQTVAMKCNAVLCRASAGDSSEAPDERRGRGFYFSKASRKSDDKPSGASQIAK